MPEHVRHGEHRRQLLHGPPWTLLVTGGEARQLHARAHRPAVPALNVGLRFGERQRGHGAQAQEPFGGLRGAYAMGDGAYRQLAFVESRGHAGQHASMPSGHGDHVAAGADRCPPPRFDGHVETVGVQRHAVELVGDLHRHAGSPCLSHHWAIAAFCRRCCVDSTVGAMAG